MERAYFFEGQQVAAEDLNAISDTLGEDMKNRTIDFFSKGVIGSNSDVFVLNDLNNTIKIEPFIAYTSDGERINMYKQIRSLAMDKSDPDDLDCVSKVHSSRRFWLATQYYLRYLYCLH